MAIIEKSSWSRKFIGFLMRWYRKSFLQTDTREKLPRIVSAVYKTVLPGTGLINLLAIPKKTT